MKNNINEAYCSFEVSKLLKEKGLEPHKLFGYVTKFYEPNTQSIRAYGFHGRTPIQKLIYRPSHAFAVEWLRVNFEVWISISEVRDYDEFKNNYLMLQGYSPWIYINKEKRAIQIETPKCCKQIFNTPQEATEAALLYVLNNLI